LVYVKIGIIAILPLSLKRNVMKTGLIVFLILLFNIPFIKAADSLNAYQIIQKYIEVIGGREKLSKIEDRVTEMKGNVQKVDVEMTIYQKQPDKFKQVIHAGEVEQTILFDNDKGYLKINDQVKEILGVELAKLKNESTLNLLLNLDTNVIHLTFLGIDTIEGKSVYKLLLKNSSLNWIHYYDVSTGFKIMDEKPVTASQGTFLQETHYSDFRPVNGIYFPFKIRQKLGQQEMEFEVTSIKINTGIYDSEFQLEN
jgi:outer membrane lipoprotein-sorting protein